MRPGGTLAYAAPEVLHTLLQQENPQHQRRMSYTRMVDVWCAGCMLFEMLFGQLPIPRFQDEPKREWLQRAIECRIEWPRPSTCLAPDLP
jgi:serine/threonine protein kinase